MCDGHICHCHGSQSYNIKKNIESFGTDNVIQHGNSMLAL